MASALPAAVASTQKNLAGLEFKSVRRNPERMDIVYRTLKLLYEDPKDALKKIERGDDRTCRLLYQGASPKGLVVYKDSPTDDYKRYGSGNSIEIKVQRLLDPERDSGKGLCTQLLNHVLAFAGSRGANAVHVKLPPSEVGLLRFYETHEFKLIKEHLRANSDKVEECVFQRLLPQFNPPQANPVTQRIEGAARPNPSPLRPSQANYSKETPRAPAPSVANSPRNVEGPLTRRSYRDVTLKNPYVSFIQQGKKPVEGRINAGMFFGVRVGDRFRFFNPSSEVFCRVTDVKQYRSFADMLTAEGYKSCIPEASSLQQAIDVYNRIPGYVERARQSGVLALHVAVEPKPEAIVSAPVPSTLKRSREGND